MSEPSEPIALVDGASCLLHEFREAFGAEFAQLHGQEALHQQLRNSWDPADYLDPLLPPLEQRDGGRQGHAVGASESPHEQAAQRRVSADAGAER